MSRFSHRQPIFTWSSVVLLSTLLLSPGVSAAVAATLLEALAHSATQRTVPVKSVAGHTEPRRSAEEEEALRAAARDGAAYLVRFDSDPDDPTGIMASIAVLFSSRGVVRVPDRFATLPAWQQPVAPAAIAVADVSAPRAPPVEP